RAAPQLPRDLLSWPRMRAAIVALGVVAAVPAHADKIEDLARQLRGDPDYKVRLSAALNLGRLGDKRAIGALIDGVSDSDMTIRAVSVAALGRLVDGSVAAADREAALTALDGAARNDADAGVKAQAQKALESLSVRVYVEIGPMADTTKRGGQVVAVMRQELVASIGRRAPSYQTRWPFGRAPSDADLKKHGTTGFFVDASITQLESKGSHVACGVSMILATYPGKSMFGFLKGNGEIDAGGPQAM